MGKYGFGVYGVNRYGEVASNTVSYNSNIYATQIDYKTVTLFWDAIIVPSTDVTPTHWKIVKTPGGSPDHPNDGISVIGGTFPVSTFTVTDVESYYPAGTEMHYSFWVFNGVDWLYCGDTSAIVVTDTEDTTLQIARMLPGVWTNSVGTFGGALSEPDRYKPNSTTQTDLYNFLSAFGYYYDYLRQDVTNVKNLSDHRFYPSAMLVTNLENLGFSYEPTLGDNYHRTLYRASQIINTFKGSRAGVRTYVTALTHFENSITLGTNLLLDYNQASFEETVTGWRVSQSITPEISSKTITNTQVVAGVATITTSAAHGYVAGNPVTVNATNSSAVYNGTWIIASAPTTTTFTYAVSTTTVASASNSGTVIFNQLSARKFADSAAELGSALSSPKDSSLTIASVALVDTLYPPRNSGYGLIASAGTTDITVTNYVAGNPQYVVPIGETRSYQFFGYARKASTNTSATANIKAGVMWLDRSGNQIGTTTYGTAVTLSTSWQYFESSNVDTAISAPLGAVFAAVSIVINAPAANDRFFLDFLSFNEYPGQYGDETFGAGQAIYEDARSIKINLSGVRTNYLPNPSFEDSKGGSLGGWSSYAGDISTNTSNYLVGTTSCKYTSTNTIANQFGALCTDWLTLDPDTVYTFSAYVKGPSSSFKAFAGVEFAAPYYVKDQDTKSYDTVQNAVFINQDGATTNTVGTSVTSRISVTSSYFYSASLNIYSNLTSSRSVTLGMRWFNSSGTALSTTTKTVAVTSTSQKITTDVVNPPSGAATMQVIIDFTNCTSTDVFYIDSPILTTTVGIGSAAVSTLSSLNLKQYVAVNGDTSGDTYSNPYSINSTDTLGTGETYYNIQSSTDTGYYGVTNSGAFTPLLTDLQELYFLTSGTKSFKIGDRIKIFDGYDTSKWAEAVVHSKNGNYSVSFLCDKLSASGITINLPIIRLANYQYRTVGSNVTLSSTQFNRVSVTFRTPNTVPARVKASIFFPAMTNGNVYYIDGCLLEKGSKLKPFFWGSGGVNTTTTNLVPAFDPYNDLFAAAGDCQWEKKLRTNLINNPSFEASGSGSTTGYAASNGTLTSVTYTSAGIPAMFGTYVGKIVTSAANSYITTTFKYPSNMTLSGSPTTAPFPYGGEEVSVSAYVYGPAGTYTINTYNGYAIKSFTVPANTWTRLSVTGLADKATTTTPTVGVVITSSIATGTWYVDGVQAELSANPTPFVDPADSATIAITHPRDNAQKIYSTMQSATGSSKSYYWPKLANKLSRLTANLPNYTPLGSSFIVKLGELEYFDLENVDSLLKSASFEKSLYGWSTSSANTTMARVVGKGALYGEVGSNSTSWLKLTNTTTSETSFDVYQNSIFVGGGNRYVCNAAAQITSSADAGTIRITVEWFDSTNTAISGSTVYKDTPITTKNRWNYIEVADATDNLTAPSTASYAKVTLRYTPTTRSSTNSVLFDRVVFKQII